MIKLWHRPTVAYIHFRWLSLKVNNRNTGAYSFQNAFFYLQFADDSLMYERNVSNPALRGALITQRKTRRLFFYFRSKNLFYSILSFTSDVPNYIHRNNVRNIFVNRNPLLRLEITSFGNLYLEEDH